MPVSGIPKDWEQKEGFGRRHGCRILRPKTFICRCATQSPSLFLFLASLVRYYGIFRSIQYGDGKWLIF